MDRQISRNDLITILRATQLPRAPELVETLEAMAQPTFHVGRQPADRSARTFEVKYGMAQERGLRVDGLEALLDALVSRGNRDVAACVVQGPSTFSLVVMNADLDNLVGILHVELHQEAG